MKRIAITQRVALIEAIGERRDALSQEWAELAEACGFLPVLLPNRRPLAQAMLAATPVDGILMTGGNDLVCYGGDAPERDELEQYLIAYAMQAGIPLLGVCRGMQMLLHYFKTPLTRVEGHVRTKHPLSNGDLVNSFHSWGALTCHAPLKSRATSADGVIEAVTHVDFPQIQGIMWHPERYHPFREEDLKFIRSVFKL